MVSPRLAALLLLCAATAYAQSESEQLVSSTLTISASLSTGVATATSPVLVPSGGTNTQLSTTSFFTTTVSTTVPVLVSYSVAVEPTAAPTPPPVLLNTHLDPAFGVLGALLILSGIPTAFWGHKNRWSSYFIVGFYSLALTTLVLILKFGVLDAINPPSKTLRGLFVFSCAVAGFIGGGVAVLIWKLARYAVGGWGGFALGLWIQCFRVAGLVRPIGFRWLFYIGMITIGFVACTIPKWHYHVMLVSTAFVGATAVILGVDCFSSAGLKEFYVYNLGFDKLFPKFYKTDHLFQHTQVMQIELGLIAAIFLMGAAVQLRVYSVLKKRLKEISDEEAKHEAEVVEQAAERFEAVKKDLDQWEKEHGRTRSNISAIPLLTADGLPATPGSAADGPNSSQFSLPAGAARNRLSEEPNTTGEVPSRSQIPGLLPAVNLGDGIRKTVPQDFVADEPKPLTPEEEAAVARRSELMDEIASIRRSIDVLRSTTGTPLPSMGSDARSRIHSLGQSLNGLEMDYGASTGTPGDRQRVHSMDMYRSSTLADTPRHVRTSSTPLAPTPHHLRPSAVAGGSISRPHSTPMQDEWDAYTKERKIVTPGTDSGPNSRRNSLFTIPTAVSDALSRRQKRESLFLENGTLDPSPPKDLEMGKVRREPPIQEVPSVMSSDDVPLSKSKHRKTGSLGSFLPASFLGSASKTQQSPGPAPVTILPPAHRQSSAATAAPAASPGQRTATFEELAERHRSKMRAMQSPLSQAEQDQAKLNEARDRWERSKKIEKTVMERKEQDSLAKRGKERGRRSQDEVEYVLESSTAARPHRHARSNSADKLGAGGGDLKGSRRLSTMKVEDWQQYQTQYESGGEGSRPKRGSVAANEALPGSQTADRRRSRTADYVLRDGHRDPVS